jgi:hypothetical protein
MTHLGQLRLQPSPLLTSTLSLIWVAILLFSLGIAIGSVAVLVSIVTIVFVYRTSGNRQWRTFLISQTIIFGATWISILLDHFVPGPYTRYYNWSMNRTAVGARLINANEKQVVPTLGAPTYVYSYWDAYDSKTHQPMPNATRTTTYNYSPYSARFPGYKFQVHCRGNKVVAIETLDF